MVYHHPQGRKNEYWGKVGKKKTGGRAQQFNSAIFWMAVRHGDVPALH